MSISLVLTLYVYLVIQSCFSNQVVFQYAFGEHSIRINCSCIYYIAHGSVARPTLLGCVTHYCEF